MVVYHGIKVDGLEFEPYLHPTSHLTVKNSKCWDGVMKHAFRYCTVLLKIRRLLWRIICVGMILLCALFEWMLVLPSHSYSTLLDFIDCCKFSWYCCFLSTHIVCWEVFAFFNKILLFIKKWHLFLFAFIDLVTCACQQTNGSWLPQQGQQVTVYHIKPLRYLVPNMILLWEEIDM